MRRHHQRDDDLERVPLGKLLQAAGDRAGLFVWNKVGTWTGVFLLLLPLVGDLVANGAKWVGWDPSPFFYANLVMSSTSYVTLPIFIIAQKVKDKQHEKREAEREEKLDNIERLLKAKEHRP